MEFLPYLAPQIECQVCPHCRLFIWASIEVSFNWQWNSLVTFQYTFITLLNFKKNELKKNQDKDIHTFSPKDF